MIIIDQEVKVIYPRTIDQAVCELQLTEIAGRNCWRSEGKMDDESYKKFIENLRKRGHESPLEFSHIMYQLDTSRDVMAELTRHRIGVAFTVTSQRYVNESAGEGGTQTRTQAGGEAQIHPRGHGREHHPSRGRL